MVTFKRFLDPTLHVNVKENDENLAIFSLLLKHKMHAVVVVVFVVGTL